MHGQINVMSMYKFYMLFTNSGSFSTTVNVSSCLPYVKVYSALSLLDDNVITHVL